LVSTVVEDHWRNADGFRHRHRNAGSNDISDQVRVDAFPEFLRHCPAEATVRGVNGHAAPDSRDLK
jgi:hypothetical protein